MIFELSTKSQAGSRNVHTVRLRGVSDQLVHRDMWSEEVWFMSSQAQRTDQPGEARRIVM